MAKSVPDGYHTVTPHLVVDGAAKAIEFYQRAFGAQEIGRMLGPDGKRLMHAVIKIGNSIVMLCDEFPDMGGGGPQTLKGSPVTLHIYVDNADALFRRAVAAGCTVIMPLMAMFWGDRYGKLTDPFGHHWSIGVHTEDLSPEETAKRAKVAFSKLPDPK